MGAAAAAAGSSPAAIFFGTILSATLAANSPRFRAGRLRTLPCNSSASPACAQRRSPWMAPKKKGLSSYFPGRSGDRQKDSRPEGEASEAAQQKAKPVIEPIAEEPASQAGPSG
eukprot:1173261-Prymnesium_polylepis.1